MVQTRSTKAKAKGALVDLAVKHGLDCKAYGGAPCKSGRAGHYLQIFLRREVVALGARVVEDACNMVRGRHRTEALLQFRCIADKVAMWPQPVPLLYGPRVLAAQGARIHLEMLQDVFRHRGHPAMPNP